MWSSAIAMIFAVTASCGLVPLNEFVDPPLLAPSVLRKESAASCNARDAPRFIGSGTCTYAASGVIIVLNTGVVRHAYCHIYVTFTVIPYYGRGVNNYVNFFMTATVVLWCCACGVVL